MGLDYYAILSVPRNATAEEIRRAFVKSASSWDAKMELLGEAYDVLASVELRQLFDEIGEEGLKREPYCYEFSKDSAQLLKEATGEASTADCSAIVRYPTKAAIGTGQPTFVLNSPIKLMIFVDLLECFYGFTKDIHYTRAIVSNGSISWRHEYATVCLKPGLPHKTAVVLPGAGHIYEGFPAGEVHLLFEQLPHPRFGRYEADLHVQQTLALGDVLLGKPITIIGIDQKLIRLEIPMVAAPIHRITVPGEGMPVHDGNGARGNLQIMFTVTLPTYLPPKTNRKIGRILKPFYN
ncbi:dnaJ homolog subfamily B member 13-like [Anopheles albimanus]|uniref:dnaJ homolog subfamily B member 13-like n=1 Tax=Anopheles albimanus TaxID=7167 RepID=UPI00164121E2|nr:dnaJ homolog subfamily B member 13-like [Anopheles albimanus]